MMDLITVLAAFACLLHVLDVHSTNRVLDRGGVELNGSVRILIRVFDRGWWAPKLAAGFASSWGLWFIGTEYGAMEAAGLSFHMLALVGLGLICAVYAYVVRRNYRVAERIGGL